MMTLSRLLAFLPAVIGLSGCAILTNPNGLVPIPSQREFEPFTTRMPVDWGSVNIDQVGIEPFRRGLVRIIGEYHGYAAERRRMEWDSTGLTTFGGIAAVAGAIADKTGLLNTGAGIAALGMSASARYNFSLQAQVYFSALKRFSCINSKVIGIPDTVFEDAKWSSDDNAADMARGAVKQLINAVDAVRIEADNSILGISPGAPSRDELLNMFNSYARAAGGPAVAGAAAPLPPDVQRKRLAGEQVKLLLSEVALCVKI